MDCFDHAKRAREIDMRASLRPARPGFEPIPIETPAGRARYVLEQQGLADAAAVLRTRARGGLRGAARDGPRLRLTAPPRRSGPAQRSPRTP